MKDKLGKDCKKIIILLGPPGAGKGTVSQRLQEENKNYKHISLGSLCREMALEDTEIGRLVKMTIDNGNLINLSLVEIIINNVFENFINNNFDFEYNTLILDGFPRTLSQTELFFNLINKYFSYIDSYIILFDINYEILKKRLLDRYICSNVKCDKIYAVSNLLNEYNCIKCNNVLFKRKDDSFDVIDSRFKIYQKEENNIINYLNINNIPFLKIDANNTVNHIADKIYEYLYSKKTSDSNIFLNQ